MGRVATQVLPLVIILVAKVRCRRAQPRQSLIPIVILGIVYVYVILPGRVGIVWQIVVLGCIMRAGIAPAISVHWVSDGSVAILVGLWVAQIANPCWC